MSRIGKMPLQLPQGVQASVSAQVLSVKGPKGTLVLPLAEGIKVSIEGTKLTIERTDDEQHTRAMHGTTRALARNAVEGVQNGYSRSLEIIGVGYRATLVGKKIALNVGFGWHPHQPQLDRQVCRRPVGGEHPLGAQA